jgi:site-specific recombinase XerD
MVDQSAHPASIRSSFWISQSAHSLVTFLVQAGKDPKTVQTLLRHADVHTTLQIYAHGRNEDRMTAQGDMLTAFFAPPTMVQ